VGNLNLAPLIRRLMTRPNSKSQFKITPLPRRRVSEAVADSIRQAIFGGKLLPGHKLPAEREMAARYRTSRVALREALRAIENEGLIIIKRGFGGGAFVSDFNNALRALLDSLNTAVKVGQAKSAHLTEVRRMLEPQIAQIATLRATPLDLQAIEAIVLAQEEELKAGKLSRRYDMEFHSCLVKATHNPVLSIVLNAINESLRESIFRSKLNKRMRVRIVGTHRSIFEAICNHNVEEAQKLMANHVLAVQGHLDTSDSKKDASP
jgi:GntR family transcriptional regulator, transcriptional repressor for pyruvate dehydrogenase complex